MAAAFLETTKRKGLLPLGFKGLLSGLLFILKCIYLQKNCESILFATKERYDSFTYLLGTA